MNTNPTLTDLAREKDERTLELMPYRNMLNGDPVYREVTKRELLVEKIAYCTFQQQTVDSEDAKAFWQTRIDVYTEALAKLDADLETERAKEFGKMFATYIGVKEDA